VAAGDRLARWLASGLGLGYLRPGPGTWGSLGAVVVVWPWVALPQATVALPILVLLATALGVWAGGRAAQAAGLHDPSWVVIDEVAGVWLALALLPPALRMAAPDTACVACFVAFRAFDVVKPWPLSSLEALPRGWGIMADDLAAGVLAAAVATVILA
jgi:phosphatidylglycerophosphatase A